MTFATALTPLAIASVVAKGTLLLTAGWCAASLLRRAPAGARHLVWLTAIIGVQLIPFMSQVAPMTVAVLPNAPAPSVAANPEVAAPTDRVLPDRTDARPGTASTAEHTTPGLGSLLLTAWLAVAFVLFARFMLGTFGLVRLVRRSRSLDSDDWTSVVREAASRLDLPHPPRVVMSDDVEMAFVCGTLHPVVIIPASADEWSFDRRRAVLLHEFAHVQRRDLIGHAVANIACALYWFNPLVWTAARRLRIESELASDDVVLRSGVRPSEYAQHLLDMVTSFGKRTPGVALAMARPKDFEGRLIAILDRTHRRSLGIAQRGAVIGGLGAFALSVAGIVPVPRPLVMQPALVHDSAPLRGDSATPSPGTLSIRPPLKPAGTRVLSQVSAATLMRFGTAAFPNPMQSMLRIADQLQLNGLQADSIATLSREYTIRMDAIWRPILARYASDDGVVSHDGAPVVSIEILDQLAPAALGVLRDEQRALLPPEVAGFLDAQKLRTLKANVARDPDLVFSLEPRRGGARMGGGGPRVPQARAVGRSGQ